MSSGLSGDSLSPTRFQFHHREFTGMWRALSCSENGSCRCRFICVSDEIWRLSGGLSAAQRKRWATKWLTVTESSVLLSTFCLSLHETALNSSPPHVFKQQNEDLKTCKSWKGISSPYPYSLSVFFPPLLIEAIQSPDHNERPPSGSNIKWD